MRENVRIETGDEAAELIEVQKKSAEEMLQIKYITKQNAEFLATSGGFVCMKFGEKECKRIALHRCFPFSCPENFISVRDEQGNEIGIIRSLDDLDKKTAELLISQMEMRYFLPQIQAISSIKDEYGYSYWEVSTDKGECRFTCNSNGSVIRLSETRVIITDISGNRYEIADIYKLLPKELKKLDMYI
ncbi:MAG: hypothetical protein K0R90_1107 [Oscillospiraceae bacterium]|jgi:hypothetical protein|nr:hypothetical protein [Oscillospiraceae bacterium]